MSPERTAVFKSFALNICRILAVDSTFPAAELDENLGLQVEAYQIKPIDLNQLIDEVLIPVLYEGALNKEPQPFA